MFGEPSVRTFQVGLDLGGREQLLPSDCRRSASRRDPAVLYHPDRRVIGSGSFDVSKLASFTGVWSIKLDNATNTFASFTLGSQAIEVDATGYLEIFVNSPSNWNSSDIVNGDTYTSTDLSFTNYQYPQQPLTYDLTSNTFSHVNSIYGGGNNLTLLINNADTAGIHSFYGSGTSEELVTAGSTLDLSHTTVSGFTVVSSNPFGTTFTVGDLGTAFQIAGGPGHDTIQTSAFTFTADQRNTIFATSSIETIIDPSGTYTAPSVSAPTISAIASSLRPFCSDTITPRASRRGATASSAAAV